MRWLLALFVAFPLIANGGVVTRTLDFQDNPAGLNGRANFNYGGLRFSAPCSIHQGHNVVGDVWMASDHDNSNCDSIAPNPEFDPYQPPNPNFLGTGWPDFYVDRHGETFSLLGLAGMGFWGTEFTVESSRGGIFHGIAPYLCCEPEVPYVTPYQWYALEGPLWTDITWFQLYNDVQIGWQAHQGWDDIRVSWQVPEPPTWAIVLPGLLGLAFRRQFPKIFSPGVCSRDGGNNG